MGYGVDCSGRISRVCLIGDRFGGLAWTRAIFSLGETIILLSMLCSGLVGFWMWGSREAFATSLGLSESFIKSVEFWYIVELWMLLAFAPMGTLCVSYLACKCYKLYVVFIDFIGESEARSCFFYTLFGAIWTREDWSFLGECTCTINYV